jgi:hypothetical protein
MVDATFCIGNLWCGLTVAHILLWVLTFAITYGILNVLGTFSGKDGKQAKTGKKVNAIIAIVMAFFILMATPATTIVVISSMSNSFVGLAVAVIILMALLTIAGAGSFWTDNKGILKAVAIILVLITIVVFLGAGGLGIIGVGSIPSFGFGPEIWVIALVVIAVLWLALEGKEEEAKKA